jgi:MYXO-CTERM domain-containing protein
LKTLLHTLLVLGLVTGVARAQDPSPTDLNWLRGECGDGALAYQADDPDYRIYLTELSNGQTVEVGPGTRPEFSPDSSKLAWIDGSTAKGRMRKGDTTVHTIATGVTEEGGVHWVSDTEVVLVKSGKWFRVSLSGDQSEVPALTALGAGGSECDVKLGGDGVWSYVTGATWKTSDGDEGGTGGTCSCSLSPDAKSVTGLEHGHKTCQLTRIRSGGVEGELTWVYDYSGDKGFDNHRWSSNDGRFVAMQDEKYNYMVIMKVGGTYCTRMGQSSGGEMYGDFTVGDGSGDPWPGTVDDPVIQLSPGSLSFDALEGGVDPDPKTVAVGNSGDGSLDTVTVDESAGWLSVAVSGSGNNQTLSNQVDISGLTEGSYQTTVDVHCANAVNTPRSYDVGLVVGVEPALARINVTPASATVVESQNADFTATARDQNGDLFPVIIDWSVSGGGSMNPASSGGAQSQHTSTFTSDGTAGTYTVTASSGGVEGTATVNVVSESQIHLKINCGDDAFTPPGWENDGPYLVGGVDFVFGENFETAGVANAAPEDVYITCRHRIRDVETVYGYDFPALPDGDYTVRLHFGDAYGPRSIDVWIEGQERISDLDIVTDAGGTYIALVKELPVTVDDGDGLQIELTDDSAEPADFFVNGIEVISAGDNQAPVVDAGVSQLITLGRSVFLDGTVSDDGLPDGTLITAWTKESGPGNVTFVNADQADTEAQIDAVGEYTLRLTADDGALQTYDEVVITVEDQPAIMIHAPNGGEVWEVGTTQQIRWTTVLVEDVQIDYSINNGQTWENIAGTVDTDDPGWGNYDWVVPDTPSTQCIMQITEYGGGTPTYSEGPFEIRRAGSDGGTDGGTDPDVSGGCGCASGGGRTGFAAWLGLFLVFLVRKRR